ncbi:MAG: PASTA domain-containing protein [Ignavibacteria bacterium]|nr:PASTA domain-containing protein [Ignavibacteria bacterium]
MDRRKAFTSRRAKKIYIALAFLILLFFVCNNFLLPWYVSSGGIVEVPTVIGKDFDSARVLLVSLGLEPRKGETRLDREHPAGIVIVQNPMPGDHVKRGRRVYLTISEGEVPAIVPSVKGRTVRDARFALEQEGLKMGTIDYQPSDEFPANTIIEQTPGAGGKVKRDAYVSVTVSQGTLSQKISVPDLAGKTLTEATTLLTNAGLRVGNISYLPSTDLLPNTVIEQYPRGGELVSNGQLIDLFVVQGGEKKKEFLEN